MQMDLEYIDNWSPWMNMRILVLTVPVVLAGRGARKMRSLGFQP